jgi:hypothetical protein
MNPTVALVAAIDRRTACSVSRVTCPPGDAEIIVLAEGLPRAAEGQVEEWLRKLAQGVPPSPVIPAEALRRENLPP